MIKSPPFGVVLALYVRAGGENRFAIALRERRATVIPNQSLKSFTRLVDGLWLIWKAKTHLTYITRFLFVRTRLNAGSFFYGLIKYICATARAASGKDTSRIFYIYLIVVAVNLGHVLNVVRLAVKCTRFICKSREVIERNIVVSCKGYKWCMGSSCFPVSYR